MQDRQLYGFYLTEVQDDYIALKPSKDGETEVKLVVNKHFLKDCESPLKMTRLLELVFKAFLKQAHSEE